MDQQEQSAFREMAAAFARRAVRPLLEHDSPDGDLDRIPAVLADADQSGLLASPRPEAAGYETGIFGRHTLDSGPRVSLLLLEELGVACGGVAMNFLALGLGSLVLGLAKNSPAGRPGRAVVALAEGGFPPGLSVIRDPSRSDPAKIRTVAVKKDDGYQLEGRKDFVYQSAGTEAYLVFARIEKDWAVFLVPAGAEGVKLEDAGDRMGLRGCELKHLVLTGARVPAEARLEFPGPLPEVAMEGLRLTWLGQLAIGTGIARGAITAARQYAAERYQGCAEIINHPGMRSLLADSETRVLTSQALLDRAALEPGQSQRALLRAAEAKLSGLPACAAAVTDCLQIFGGYGYMEDYRMEKRYRDVNTLKGALGGPRDLRSLVADLSLED